MSINFVILLINIVISFLCYSCQTMDARHYLGSQRYSKKINRNNYTIIVTYLPTAYLFTRGQLCDSLIAQNVQYDCYIDVIYFSVEIQKHNMKSKKNAENIAISSDYDALYRNTFQKQNDIFLINKNDTIPIADYHYERNWGLGDNENYILSFHRDGIAKSIFSYHLIIRNAIAEFGTIDIPLNSFNCKAIKSKGVGT